MGATPLVGADYRARLRGRPYHSISAYIRANVDPEQAIGFAVSLYTGQINPESLKNLRGLTQRWDPVKWLDLRLRALMWLVERGWGKAVQPVEVESNSLTTTVNVNLSGLTADELHQLRALTAKVQAVGPSVTAQALSAMVLQDETRVESTVEASDDVTP